MMNKEYLYLSNKEILVTDENGRAVKRDIVSTDMHEILLLENDLEKINSGIIQVEKIIQIEEEAKLSIKGKIILAAIVFIIPMTGFCIACLSNPNLFSKMILTASSIALFEITFASVYTFFSRYRKKYINGIRSELATAYQLKEELEQRLSNIKNKSKDSISTNIAKSQKNSLQINDVIVLEESTPFFEEAEKQLEESYARGYNQKGKKLVLKK